MFTPHAPKNMSPDLMVLPWLDIQLANMAGRKWQLFEFALSSLAFQEK